MQYVQQQQLVAQPGLRTSVSNPQFIMQNEGGVQMSNLPVVVQQPVAQVQTLAKGRDQTVDDIDSEQ